MFQPKYKYFNKKIKMLLLLLLLFILMWSLMKQQHVQGKSLMYKNGGIITAAVAADDTKGMSENFPENVAEITVINDAKTKSSPTSLKATTTEYKGEYSNAATTTIYDRFNGNEYNSNKLPYSVEKRNQQQPNMMYMNMIMPATLKSTSSLISTMSEKAIIKTATTTPTTTTDVVSPPPTESMLLPKDQLNKKQCSKMPQRNKNKLFRGRKIKFNYTVARQAVISSTTNHDKSNNMRNILKDNKAIESNLYKLPSKNNTNKVVAEIGKDYADLDGINNTNFKRPIKLDSIAQAHQQLITQFALEFKQIPRVIYFTCKKATLSNNYKRHTDMNMDIVEFVKRMYLFNNPGLMMRLVLIDHLGSMKNITGRGNATRNTFTTANWLEGILRPEALRQIVVLNLSCGLSSRRLLEMASAKAFFNSKYHWLLLEDYVFNRQTEIDDAVDNDNEMNSHPYSRQTDKSFEEEIVNDTNTANVQVKNLSTYPKDVAGVLTSGSGPDEHNNGIPANSASESDSSFQMIGGKKSKQQLLVDLKSATASNASHAGITDADDIEIIEKFLEKLNININTELILAKRCTRVYVPLANSSASSSLHNMMPRPASSTTNLTLTASNDCNKTQKMNYYLFYDVWNPGLQYGGVLNISKIGYFTSSEGLKLAKWYSTTSTTRRRLNMHLARIRCLVVITHENRSDTLEEYLNSHYDTHLDSMNRFNFALLTHVRDLFNFSFILSQTSTWGYLKNGKFDGMIGALVRQQADIGGSPIFFRIERARVIDYTTRTWVARPCFIFRHPRSTKQDRIIFLQPFSNDVWILLFACGCLTIILLWILNSLERKFNANDIYLNEDINFSRTEVNQRDFVFGKNKKVSSKEAGFWNSLVHLCSINMKNNKFYQPFGLFFESLLFYIGSICQQGLLFSTRFFSGRCIVITSLLFSFAIYQFYSASIVGTLLMEKSKTIRTLQDLIHSSLEIGIEDIVYNRDYFLRTKDPDALELYAKKVSSVPMAYLNFGDVTSGNITLPTQMINMTDAQKAKAYRDILHSHETRAHAESNEASNWYDPDYGVARLKKGHFAFHVDVATAYKIIADTFTEKEICELAEIQLFPPQKMVSIVQKGSPLRKAITYGLRRVTEVGVTDYQRKIWHSSKPRCVKQLHTDDLRVDMQTFTSALLVLIFGYAVSLMILSLEIVHFKLWQR